MHRLIPLGLVAAILVVYAGALHGPFLWDDGQSVVFNPHIRSLWPLTETIDTHDSPILGGRPIVAISLALNYAVGGTDPTGYHLFNIAIHVANALLLFGLIRRTMLLPRWEGRFERAEVDWFAGAVALIWSMHPLQTEAVDYVTQRSESMMSLCVLLMLYAVARGARSTRPIRWNSLAILACAVGMACKQTMVIAPVLAMLFDWIFLPRRLPGRRILHAGLLATWLVMLLFLRGQDVNSMNPPGQRPITAWIYLETEMGVIVHYLRLCFWPRGLTIDYRDWPPAENIASVALDGLVLLALLAASIICCVRRAWPGFVGGWFFLILAPTSSILPLVNEMVAERRMYLPLVAIVVLVVALAWRLIRAFPAAGAVGVIALAVVLGISTGVRNREYQSTIGFWTDAIQKRPGSPMARYYLSWAYADIGDWKNARIQAEMSLANHAPAHWLNHLLDFINQHDPHAHPPK